MKTGSTFILIVNLDVNMDYVNDIIFTIKCGSRKITKTEYEYDSKNKRFEIPLNQEDTVQLEGRCLVEAQINFTDNSVAKSEIGTIYINETLATKIINGNQATKEGAEVELNIDGNIIYGGNYILPVAKSYELGGVMPIEKTEEMTKEVGVDEIGRLYTKSEGEIDVDSYLSETSTNPVQNKVVTEELGKKVNKNHAEISGSLSMGRKEKTKIGANSVALGGQTSATVDNATALGWDTTASGNNSLVFGNGNKATRENAFSGGIGNIASGENSMSLGDHTETLAKNAVAIGENNKGYSKNSLVCGKGNVASISTDEQVVFGRYNKILPNKAFIIGKGIGNSNDNRSNAYELDWNGNGWYAGKLSQEGQPANAKDLTTKKYVDDKISENIVVIEKDFASMETPEFCLNDLLKYEKSGIYIIKSTSQNDKSYVDYYYMDTRNDVEHISVFHWTATTSIMLLVNYSYVFESEVLITLPNNSVLQIWISDGDGGEYGEFIKNPIDTEFTLKVNDRLYDGSNLLLKHSNEIRKYSDVWAWIKARIKNNNFEGIHVEDYIPMHAKNGNQTYNMQIAGIDTYYNTQDLKIGHHIDFVSKECYIRPFQWNTTANNNGTSAKNSPYLASNIYRVLGELASAVLPQEVQNQIVEKKTIIERRYSADGALTASTTQSVQNIGKLWLPSEYEVFGSVVRGTPEWSQGSAVQYPLFANSSKNRAKMMVGSDKIVNWWLLTTHYGDTTSICTVGKNASINGASNSTIYFPICFRIDDSIN